MTDAKMEPTAEQFGAYRAMFRHSNKELFGGSLPEPLLNLSRAGARTVAFFAPLRWRDAAGDTIAHEISLNPAHLADGSACDTAQSLVHEMAHEWQQVFGKPPRRGYHDRQWSKKMVEIGLQPINAKTGEPSMSAHSMCDRVIPGGAFARAFESLPAAALLPWSCLEARRRVVVVTGDDGEGNEGDGEGAEPAPKPRNKIKFTCPECGANAWGKPSLHLLCDDGHEPARLVAADAKPAARVELAA